MIYARIDLTAHAVVSTGPLPPALVGLSDASLADIAAAVSPCPPEFDGIGYWPVVADVKPAVADGEEAVPAADAALVVDLAAAVVRRPWVVQPAPPPPVPAAVTRLQGNTILRMRGLYDQVSQAVAESGDTILMGYWADASEFRRDSPSIAAIASVIGMTDADLDQMFREAAQITA